MGYLVCDSCKGYYELKSDESPDDFINKCECGGTLNFVESLDIEGDSSDVEASKGRTSIEETSHIEYSKTDPEVNETSNLGISDGKSNKTRESSSETSKIDPRIIRLTAGILIVLIPNFLFASSFNILFLAFSGIPLLLAGFVSSIYTQERRFKDGILNGARVGLFSGIIYLFISLIISLVYGTFNLDLISGVGIFILSFLVLILLTSFGGFLGIGIFMLIEKLENQSINRKKKSREVQKTDYDMETETVNQIQVEETEYRDDLVKLSYKQMSAINDGEKVFNCLLSDSISENDAIMRLKDDQKVVHEVLAEMKEITPPERYKDYHNLKIESSTDICKTFENIDGLINNNPTKIEKTNNLVENSTNKINQAISELHKTMWEENQVKELK